ncbi:YheC/YheD family protein [Cohnella cellulosilytica]|uniref:YheC/YheD family protein n=1 Tax=Cohnella cellulosilytica TaxID=986710 RepID=A0ABW2F6S4_9BACL
MPQHVTSKWKKTAALRGTGSLRRLIPETVRFDSRALRLKLERYGMVYVKPESGMHGKGVMRAELIGGGRCRLRSGSHRRDYPSGGTMAQAIRRTIRGRKYLIQRGIHLLRYRGRVFDLRVMAQLTPSKRWRTTGIIGRVAGPRKIVTNYHNGGRLVPVGRLLGSNMGKRLAERKIRELENIGVEAGRALRHRYPGVCEVGVDIGLDRAFKPWIIEVNTRPDPYIFRKLPDPSVFRRIRKYARAYGRK